MQEIILDEVSPGVYGANPLPGMRLKIAEIQASNRYEDHDVSGRRNLIEAGLYFAGAAVVVAVGSAMIYSLI